MSKVVKLTNRDDQIIAISLFGRGNDEVIFNTPSRLSERAQRSLNNLVNKGALIFQTVGGGHKYKGNKSILGTPLRDYAPPSEAEDFNILK